MTFKVTTAFGCCCILALSGLQVVFSSRESNPVKKVGFAAVNREHVDPSGYGVTIINPQRPVPYYGAITSFNIFAKESVSWMVFQVWRRFTASGDGSYLGTADQQQSTFELVAQTKSYRISASQDSGSELFFNDFDRLNVEPGDLIAIEFSGQNPIVFDTSCVDGGANATCCDSDRQVLHHSKSAQSFTTVVGDRYGFDVGMNLPAGDCRQYSLKFSMLPTMVCETLPVERKRQTLVSPGFPKSYTKDTDLCYIFESVEPQRRIKLIFNTFELEDKTPAGCTYDYVRVRDGPDQTSTLLSEACGEDAPSGTRKKKGSIFASSNTLYLHFHSDRSIQKKGFEITYRIMINAKPTISTNGSDIAATERENMLSNWMSVGLPIIVAAVLLLAASSLCCVKTCCEEDTSRRFAEYKNTRSYDNDAETSTAWREPSTPAGDYTPTSAPSTMNLFSAYKAVPTPEESRDVEPLNNDELQAEASRY